MDPGLGHVGFTAPFAFCRDSSSSSGHFSASDRYRYIRELAFEVAFVLDSLGMAVAMDLQEAGLSAAEAAKLLDAPARRSRSLTQQLQPTNSQLAPTTAPW